MAACTFNRVDSRNTSTSASKYASRLIVDPASPNEIMLAWLDQGIGGGTPQPQSVRFARFDVATLTPNSEVAIAADYTFSSTTKAPDMIRLDDGRLIALWYSAGTIAPGGANTSASESSDGGATWSTPININELNDPGDQNISPIALMTDGTTVWAVCVQLAGGGPFGTGDVFVYTRTAADTWSAAVSIYNGTVSGTPGAWCNAGTQPEQQYEMAHMASSTAGFMVGYRSADAANNTFKLTALYTTDGWATATPVDLRNFGVNSANTAITVVKDESGRYYLLTNDNAEADDPLILFYTDDDGATWTEIGTPTVLVNWYATNSVGGDGTYDSFMCFDVLGNLVIGQSTQASFGSSGIHGTFRSAGDPTNVKDWVLAGECTYNASNIIPGTTAGRAVIIDDTMYRLVGMSRSAAPAYYTLEFLAVEDFPVPEPDPDPVVPEAVQSGANNNSIYLRNNLAEGGGSSAHLFPVAFFMDWDEGDRETGREVPMILAANPSMDPAIQDPALIDAFSRISDPGSWTRRVYINDGDQVQTRHDPLLFRVITQKYTITEEFNRNVARGVLVAWTLTGDSEPTISVWIDEKLNHVVRLYNTYGQKVERFFPLPTFNNVGSEVQFVVEDLSPHFFAIEALGLKLIPKLIRGG